MSEFKEFKIDLCLLISWIVISALGVFYFNINQAYMMAAAFLLTGAWLLSKYLKNKKKT